MLPFPSFFALFRLQLKTHLHIITMLHTWVSLVIFFLIGHFYKPITLFQVSVVTSQLSVVVFSSRHFSPLLFFTHLFSIFIHAEGSGCLISPCVWRACQQCRDCGWSLSLHLSSSERLWNWLQTPWNSVFMCLPPFFLAVTKLTWLSRQNKQAALNHSCSLLTRCVIISGCHCSTTFRFRPDN